MPSANADRGKAQTARGLLKAGAAVDSGSGKFVEKQIEGGNPAVAGDDEISPGVSWRLVS